jgi:hypothetical protein
MLVYHHYITLHYIDSIRLLDPENCGSLQNN